MHHAALPSLTDIYNMISQLSLQNKSALMEFLQQTLPPKPHLETPKCNIYDLKGIGKEIWKETDAQEYVNQERDSWFNFIQTAVLRQIEQEQFADEFEMAEIRSNRELNSSLKRALKDMNGRRGHYADYIEH